MSRRIRKKSGYFQNSVGVQKWGDISTKSQASPVEENEIIPSVRKIAILLY